MRNLTSIFILLALTALCGIAVAATCGGSSGGTQYTIFPMNPTGCAEMPRIPMTFGGCVYINGMLAPAGTIVSVTGTNVNPNTLVLDGSSCFGAGPFDPKLIVQGTPTFGGMLNVPEGGDLKFYVNGVQARVCVNGGTCQWTTQYHSGHHTTVTLYSTCVTPMCGG